MNVRLTEQTINNVIDNVQVEKGTKGPRAKV